MTLNTPTLLEQFLSFVLLLIAACTAITYPELRSDLQDYQDASRCYPDVGEWYMIFRSYYDDPDFGGVQKCVKFRRYGIYSFENYSTSIEYVIGKHAEESIRGHLSMTSTECYAAKDLFNYYRYDNISIPRNFHVLYTDCLTCTILRHQYAAQGYGCSYWLRIDTGFQDNDGCEFIYDENCGTSPKYYFYDNTCPM